MRKTNSQEEKQAKEKALPGLSLVVLSWSLGDILNQYLYKHKVVKIPETFSSAEQYLRSFKTPLVEETHADVRSSLSLLPHAPTCVIKSVRRSEDYKEPGSLRYYVRIQTHKDDRNKRNVYQPQTWDVIALSDVIPPVRIDDLNRPPRYYQPAIIIGVKDEDASLYEVFSFKSIRIHKCNQESDQESDEEEEKRPLFATFLINLTTNIRIWRGLNVEEENKNLGLIKEVLNADSKVGERCGICSSQEKQVLMEDLKSYLNSMNLNQSQVNAVYSSIESTQCNHKCSIRLVWGPPGTGKTKTVASMLSLLLRMKCRTLTCAPTNIAVVQVAFRLLELVKESIQQDLYGLGDIVLVGNKKRMIIDDHEGLSAVFLNHRVDTLAVCFAPLSGWTHQVNSMISLLEDPCVQYQQYLEELKKKNEEEESGHNDDKSKMVGSMKKKEKVKKEDEASQSIPSEDQNRASEVVLTFSEFLRKHLERVTKNLKYCIKNFCMHLPTSFISKGVVLIMKKFINSLKPLIGSLSGDNLRNEELEKAFEGRKQLGDVRYWSSASLLINEANDCLQLLKSIQTEFYEVPPFELLVIDEAAQLKECESAIPLQLTSLKHTILIGDELQLPDNMI